jgi:hypothetical protein
MIEWLPKNFKGRAVRIQVYRKLKKSELSREDALRLVRIIKRASEEEGIAIFKSLAWSIDRALKRRRVKRD